MFREIREVESNIEREERRRRERERWNNGAGKIKPETNMTVEQAKDYWNQLFANIASQEG